MGDCNTCPLYQAAEKFAATSCAKGNHREFATPVGSVIASRAAEYPPKGIDLTALSVAAGYADDYVARICRGKLTLNARAAKLIGDVLGIDLSEYVVASMRAPRKRKVAPDAPGLPGIGEGAAA